MSDESDYDYLTIDTRRRIWADQSGSGVNVAIGDGSGQLAARLPAAECDRLGKVLLGAGRELPPIVLDGYAVPAGVGDIIHGQHWTAGRSDEPGKPVRVVVSADLRREDAIELAQCIAYFALEPASPGTEAVAQAARVLEAQGCGTGEAVGLARALARAGLIQEAGR